MDEDASAGNCWQNNYPSDLPPKPKEVHSLQWSTLGHVFIFFRRVTKRSVKEVVYTHKIISMTMPSNSPRSCTQPQLHLLRYTILVDDLDHLASTQSQMRQLMLSILM